MGLVLVAFQNVCGTLVLWLFNLILVSLYITHIQTARIQRWIFPLNSEISYLRQPNWDYQFECERLVRKWSVSIPLRLFYRAQTVLQLCALSADTGMTVWSTSNLWLTASKALRSGSVINRWCSIQEKRTNCWERSTELDNSAHFSNI